MTRGLRYYFPSKEGVLQIFIAFKNPSHRPDFNPRPFSPVANTLTATPPREQPWKILNFKFLNVKQKCNKWTSKLEGDVDSIFYTLKEY
jgi:hypothetical protein